MRGMTFLGCDREAYCRDLEGVNCVVCADSMHARDAFHNFESTASVQITLSVVSRRSFPEPFAVQIAVLHSNSSLPAAGLPC